ncbi:hypothetical protein SAMN05660649_00963 [Desulfotomaculum arcticum]|uniref:Uncharacterized protein n=2 Tax=Desulfotruncus TaxID=2867377 RepID=A0A1I2PKU9_9FIRM|nr:hypothetical protein SAMN05660649_00963 [Desulfotomaculum arcticum] [Desulfotruncus arcticus DSM 17038]
MQDDNQEKKTEDASNKKKQTVKEFFLLWIIMSILLILISNRSIFSLRFIFEAIIGTGLTAAVACFFPYDRIKNFKFCKKNSCCKIFF